MNAPKLRFKEFNDEWKNKNLSELVSFSKGNLLSKSDLDENGVYPCILYGQLYTTYHEVIRKVYYKTNNNSKNITRSKYGDILIPSSGETPIDISTSSCLLLDNILLGGDINILSPTNCDGRFISYMINNNKRTEIAKVAQGHSIVHLYNENLKKVNLQIPTMNEQIKIANALELLDKKLELQTKKIEDLKLFKLELKERLFKMFETEQKELENVITKWNKKNKDNKYKYVESVSNKYGFIAQNEQFEDRTIASNDTQNYYVIEKGVFAYNPSRLNVGSLALKDNDKVSLVSPLYECFTTNQNNKFLYEWFNSKEFKKGTVSKFEGGVRNTMNFSNLCKIKISLPSLENQNKISNILILYNNLINFENRKLIKLQELKKGLMQNMFV